MGGGGKGGSQSQQVQIPKFIEDVAQRNLARAETAQKIDYMPYMGPEVAAFNPTQVQSMQNQIGAAQAFGMAPAGMNAMAGMPQPQTFEGGVQGYSSFPLYQQALAEVSRLDPASYQQREKMFVASDGTYLPTFMTGTAGTPSTVLTPTTPTGTKTVNLQDDLNAKIASGMNPMQAAMSYVLNPDPNTKYV